MQILDEADKPLFSRQPESVRQARAFEQDAPISRQNLRGVKDAALRQIDMVMSHPGKVSLWDKTVGTMRHLGEREPAFKPVFDAAQRFIDDVAMLASEVADAAPRLLPKIETVGDIFGRNRKKPISAADNKAVAKPLFEGTLLWGRDVDGKATKLDALRAKYEKATTDEKVQMMLGAGYLRPEVLKAWQGTKKIEQFEKAKVFGKLRTHNNTFHASSVVFLRQKSAKRGASPKT